MNKLKSIFFIISIFLFSCISSADIPYLQLNGFIQGTSYNINYQSKKLENYTSEILQIFAEIDSSVSLYNQLSLLYKINSSSDSLNTIDNHIKYLINTSEKLSLESKGLFDITVAPLVNAWGFGADNKQKRDSNTIDSILKFVSYTLIRVKNNYLIKKDIRVKIDLNAIAQGYTVDLIAEFFEKKNIKNYLIEVGGEVRAKGINSKGLTWRIGIDKPIDNNNEPGRNLQTIVSLKNKSLATSGNYRKFYEENGVKYAHTINPKTGYPAKNNVLSASIVTKDCALADAYATACMVSGLEASKLILKNHPEMDALLIYSDTTGKILEFKTKGFQEMVEP